MPDDWNFTYLCLLPKIPSPEVMADFRPISLCSVLYKIVSKVLVKRLQPILPNIISINQTAFVSDRLMTDNILVAHEAVHALKTHPTCSQDFMVVKTDMSKAYDKVEWSYLRRLMEALGFNQVWVRWVMTCISSTSFAVLMNDQPFGLIKPQRGIRQGDPLSPFLFAICTEGLTHLLNRAEREGLVSGFRFSEHGPSIHHLLFADDSLFLCLATSCQARVLHDILGIYGSATGQTINFQKSAISFGEKVNQQNREVIQSALGIFNEGGTSKYLGLPQCFSGSKVELLGYLKERMKGRLSTWFLRKLSQGGKEVLLKATASALPVLAMSCFRLPKSVCSNLSSAMADFWWGSDSHQRKIHWISWDKLCLPKESGGMGFRDLEAFNQALLAKQAWKILTSPHCLLASFVKSRYFPEVEFLDAKLGDRPSFAWRSILFGRDLLIKGLKKRVGNGNSINVWLDKWVEDDSDGYGLRAPWIKSYFFDVNLKARSLIDFDAGRWNRQALEEVFVPSDIHILMQNQPVISKEDFWSWKFNRSGEYSVKSGYWLATREKTKDLRRDIDAQPSVNCLKQQAWKVHSSPKLRCFIWKVLSYALPVNDLLGERGLKGDDRCQTCGLEGESVNHVLFCCDVARQTWAMSNIPTPEGGYHQSSIFVNLQYLFKVCKMAQANVEVCRLWPWIIWYLWKNRNNLLFEGTLFSPINIIQKASEEADLWFMTQQVEQETELALDGNSQFENSEVVCPPFGWVTCEVGLDWSGVSKTAGASWVVRDCQGVVREHSRRSFVGFSSLLDAKSEVLWWAIESMSSLKKPKVIFVSEFQDLFGAVFKTEGCPALKVQAAEMRLKLQVFEDWDLQVVSWGSIRGVSFIAQSVNSLGLLQSYVAAGHPRWLDSLFDSERRSSVLYR